MKYVLQFNHLLPTLNQTKRMNIWALKSLKRKWQKHIKAELIYRKYTFHEPMQKAKITIKRYSTKSPDYDNMVGGGKEFIDLFTTPKLEANGHVRNKYGLGIVVDDSPAHLKVVYEWTQASLLDQKTVVEIEPI
jgi:hypothetical protein